ncbi:NUDIX domain-containing protein [Hyphococcus flavus]|uniref:NUDIX domain-containing protein n=1 Tax=Hyphococcus flavus TaxID=1866326 RepID=A0AAE9ZHX7_9PROT|nr:NUDIX domain-containing protein [Hyphococcus flavus]WDI31191.1 NUDIX domain-containing protein [Hyphococcus flavus]
MSSDYIQAATILLLRDEPAFEVLMVERHANIEFAGGAMVFPGGRMEASDADKAWLAHCDGLEQTPEHEISHRVAAIREAFEETGMLLARKDGEFLGREAMNFEDLRGSVEEKDALFLELICKEKLKLALDALHLFARWRPPKEATHKRFDTWFFAAKAPPKQQARPDGGEATDVIWTQPKDVLADKDAGRRKMIFPTTRNVELLGVSNNTEEAIAFANERPIRPVTPAPETRDGVAYLTIPEDLGYPVTAELLETAFRI